MVATALWLAPPRVMLEGRREQVAAGAEVIGVQLRMRLIEHCRAVLPIEVHEVRYESLIADFDATTMALCVAVGVPWSPAMRTFDRTAHRRGVGTASALQVRRGLYDGSGQWRRYREQLEPVLPILAAENCSA